MATSDRIEQRSLGRSGVEVGVISLGSWHTWERMDFTEAVDLFTLAVERGANTFDVGNYNSGLHDEGLNAHRVLGRVMKESGVPRHLYRVELKVWLWEQGKASLGQAFEDDAAEMGLDEVDILLAGHYYDDRPEYFSGDLDDKIRELSTLVAQGRAKTWGMCNWGPAHTRRALELTAAEGLPAPEVLQLKYSVARRSIVEGAPLQRVLDEWPITLQPSDVLEGGYLVGKTSSSRRVGYDAGGIIERVIAAAPGIADVAARMALTPAQAAIAFCLSNPSTSTVLVGASSERQLLDNLGAAAVTRAQGRELRAALADYWLDRDVVSATAAP